MLPNFAFNAQWNWKKILFFQVIYFKKVKKVEAIFCQYLKWSLKKRVNNTKILRDNYNYILIFFFW